MPTRCFWTVTLVLLAIYCANRDFLPGNDARVSVFAPINLLAGHGFAFTPTRDPSMFSWFIETNKGSISGRIEHWDDTFQRRMFSYWRDEGIVHVGQPGYFLVPTRRTDSATGDREYVNSFGVGAALTALPLYALAKLCVVQIGRDPWWLWYLGKLSASICVALSAGFLFLIANRFAGWKTSAVVAVAYGLGTGVWSTASQSLWQHGPDLLFLCIGMWLFLNRGGDRDTLFGAEPHYRSRSCADPRVRSMCSLSASFFYVIAANSWPIARARHLSLSPSDFTIGGIWALPGHSGNPR